MKSHVDDIQSYANQATAPSSFDIPLVFTWFRDSEGSGNVSTGDFIPQEMIDEGISNLNEAFSGAGLNFIQCGEINNLDITQVHVFDEYPQLFYSTSTALDVYIINAGLSYSSIFPSEVPGVNSQAWVRLSAPDVLTTTTFIHEVGHCLSLLHTAGDAGVYNNPNDPLIPEFPNIDHPYTGYSPHELVIREYDGSKDWPTPNCDIAGDFVCDTPASCNNSSGEGAYNYPDPTNSGCMEWPANDSNPCTTGCLTFNCDYVGNYVDYNGDPISPTPAGTVGTITSNYMAQLGRDCRTEFTPGQMERVSYYMYEYEDARADLFNASFCMNFNDFVEFEDTDNTVQNVRIEFTHPNEERKSIMTTGINGVLQGNHYKQETFAKREKMGSNTDFSFSIDDWLNGVFTSDIIRIRQHVLNAAPLNGYKQIAADVNSSGSVTTADIVFIRKLILGDIIEFPGSTTPWRFIPEYIVEDFADSFHSNPFNMLIDGVQYVNNAPYLNNSWQYDILNGSSGANGFDVVKLGHVTGSVNLSFIEEDSESVDVLSPELIVELKEIEGITDGYKFKFDIHSQAAKASFQAGIEFDKTKLEYENVNTQNILTDFSKDDHFGLSMVNDGKLRFLWDSPVAEDEDIITNPSDFEIDFKSELSESELLNEITINSLERSSTGGEITGIIKLDTEFQNRAFGKDGIPARVKMILSPNFKFAKSGNQRQIIAYPNPFNNTVTFDFSMMEEREGKITIYDNLGQIVFFRNIENGANSRVTISGLENLPSGVYYYSFSSINVVQSGKFVKQ